MLPELVVYSRPGCHLCETLIEGLIPLTRHRARLTVRNVDDREEWQRAFGLRIPVVCHDDVEICAVRLDPEAIRALLAGIAPGG